MLTRRQFNIGASSVVALAGAPAYGQAPGPDGKIAMVDAPVNVCEYVERLKANGVVAIGRYFARKAQPELGLPQKRIAFEKAPNGQTEADFIRGHGINIHSVYQYYSGGDGSKFLLGRSDTQTPKREAEEDAKAAFEQAKLIKQPEGTAIYFGVDYNCVKDAKGPGGKPQIEFIMDYFRIVNAKLGGHYRVGKWIEWLGPERIWELYGGTEAQGACIISGTEWLEHKGSVGKIGETSRLRIIGEDGNEVATGETGEIYFLPNDGAGTSYHYLGADPKRRADGWESLGDIGRLDADGYLYLGDRLADMILRGGANIYPAEVEAAVSAHPQVLSCVAVGLPDGEFGQRVHAILELGSDTDAQAVVDGMGAFLADRLSRYKHPESFEVTSVGLRDDSGKVRRTLLRDERAAWVKENRAFRIVPARAAAKAG